MPDDALSSIFSTHDQSFPLSEWNELSDGTDFTDMTVITDLWRSDESSSHPESSSAETVSDALPSGQQENEGSRDSISGTNAAPGFDAEIPTTIVSEALFPVDLAVPPFFVDLKSEYVKISGCQQQELSKALKKLTTADFSTSFYNKFKDEDRDEHSVCHGQEFSQQCIEACYSDPRGIGLLLDRKLVEDIFRQEQIQEKLDPASLALVNAVLAVGAHSLNFQGNFNIQATPLHNAPAFFEKALKLRHQLPSSEMSIRDLQAFLTMLYFSVRTGSKMTSELMMSATHCVQALRLNNQGAICRVYQTRADQADAKRALCFLYSIEMPYCLRYRIFPLLNWDSVDYVQPDVSLPNQLTDWLSIQYQYSLLCSTIIRNLYGQTIPRRPQSEKFEHALSVWKDELPLLRDSTGKIAHDYLSMSSLERKLQLGTLFQYHEALITMFMGRTETNSLPLGLSDINQSQKDEICLSSAREVLTVSCHISTADVHENWSLYYLVCLATYVIFVFIIRQPSCREDFSYLGMALGFFGRLSLDAEVPFEEVTELCKIAWEAGKDYSLKDKQK
ncbi:hypothetical protein N431DRAFT_478512 [Stipitochalara longipes BDJ]|nr:hypothetical protein N431DRAFT_478512 [Stipitochalara longipes BDJ]